MAVFGDVFAGEDMPDSQKEDFQIQPKGLMLDVPDVIVKLLFPGHIVAAVDLRPAGDARFDLVAAVRFTHE